MNKIALKKLITESVLNFLNDAKHWKDVHGILNFADDLPDKIKVDDKESGKEFDIPIKSSATEPTLFDRWSDSKTINTFKLNRK